MVFSFVRAAREHTLLSESLSGEQRHHGFEVRDLATNLEHAPRNGANGDFHEGAPHVEDLGGRASVLAHVISQEVNRLLQSLWRADLTEGKDGSPCGASRLHDFFDDTQVALADLRFVLGATLFTATSATPQRRSEGHGDGLPEGQRLLGEPLPLMLHSSREAYTSATGSSCSFGPYPLDSILADNVT
jgi:hypothetical protein